MESMATCGIKKYLAGHMLRNAGKNLNKIKPVPKYTVRSILNQFNYYCVEFYVVNLFELFSHISLYIPSSCGDALCIS